ncbi:tRNA preQ1(34) S-adenosylmethionine ribosyltransferase-isomerase QueA [Alienimonas chondri]|uniref:S-adenosylmethionine:tRNA ribosyltransferase-isomerase n=1 Tax=Alienimonas chondri TaxID=2681879 RepID=A0ABX1VFE7_9PLAN|nr:tRNA preQ1(34) S-adenosylmethionine ribosyltransferase-isomerase QueA [Alienimonas chondri]NNJ25997.1 S-adenosylmethionine:tRNA ribosyltransferase-isomerase [Alienimonas chondri]
MAAPPPKSSFENPADLSVEAYDYELPPDRIAFRPAPRGTARLLTLDRRTGAVAHRSIADLPHLLAPGDRLVLNDSRVVPARLRGVREATGGKWEGLFLSIASPSSGAWRVMSKTRGTLLPGEVVRADGPGGASLRLRMEERGEGGVWTAIPLDASAAASPFAALEAVGSIPLPPYIGRNDPDEQDRADYQTVFADRPGSVAAPTAGLHFTPELLAACESRGVHVSRVTLHVGVGTFRPMDGERIVDHQMHAESCELSATTAEEIRATRESGGRVIAVGTTACRTLEAAAAANDAAVGPFCGETEIFIYPPHRFAGVDGLLTNFHLPKSTLLVLVSALAGRERVLAAYREAVDRGYRFFSYGDAMLIL